MFGAKSKTYESIMTKLRTLMGNEEATEAEVDQYLAGIEEIPGQTEQTDESELQTQLTEANGQVEALTKERDNFKGQVEKLTKERDGLKSELEEANEQIETVTGERDEVAGKYATLKTKFDKAPKPSDAQKPNPIQMKDDELEEEMVVETKDIDKMLSSRASILSKAN